MVAPEHVEELVVRDLCRVVGNLYNFGMAGTTGADFLVGRVFLGASREAHGGRNNAIDLAEGSFHAPETPAPKVAT